MIDKKQVASEAIKGAAKSGFVGAAGSIISGVAMASVPIKLLGLFTVGTATVVSLPVVLAVGGGAAVVGGAAAAYLNYRKQRNIEAEFEQLVNSSPARQHQEPESVPDSNDGSMGRILAASMEKQQEVARDKLANSGTEGQTKQT